MKRIYVKPLIKVVSCRPMCFVAASDPTQWQVEGPTPYNPGQPNPGNDGDDDETGSSSRGLIWDI